MLRYRVLGPMCDGVREERRPEEKSCVPQPSTVRAEAGDTRANVGHATGWKRRWTYACSATWAWVQTTENSIMARC